MARDASPAARASLFYTVELRKTKLGKILVASSGYTLYAFSKDSRGKDTCVKITLTDPVTEHGVRYFSHLLFQPATMGGSSHWSWRTARYQGEF